MRKKKISKKYLEYKGGRKKTNKKQVFCKWLPAKDR